MRHMSHYDYKYSNLRCSILFDIKKAYIIYYTINEKSILNLAKCTQTDKDWKLFISQKKTRTFIILRI
ncbi:MAG: hypothetical protein LBQ13_03625 [Endomicrobium sp.]|nr:hypothetical protein [Endomicrobium sp.]